MICQQYAQESVAKVNSLANRVIVRIVLVIEDFRLLDIIQRDSNKLTSVFDQHLYYEL